MGLAAFLAGFAMGAVALTGYACIAARVLVHSASFASWPPRGRGSGQPGLALSQGRGDSPA